MPKLTKDDIGAKLREQISLIETNTNKERVEHVSQSLKYYECKPRGDEKDGRCPVVSPDLRNMVEAVMADIVPILACDELGQFDPQNNQDEQPAAQETAAVNYMIMKKARGFIVLCEAVKDALLGRVSYVRVKVEELKTSRRVVIDGVSALGIEMFPDTLKPDETIAAMEFEPSDEKGIEGEPLYELRATIETTKRTFGLVAVPPEDMYVSADVVGMDLQHANLVAQRFYPTRAELVAMGASAELVDALPIASQDDNKNARGTRYQQRDGLSKSTESVEAFDCFAMIDINDNNKPELHRYICDRNGVIIYDEPATCTPFACGVISIKEHEHSGVDLHDRLKETQSLKTWTIRHYIDNMAMNNNRRIGVVEGEVDMDDLQDSKPGGYIKIKHPQALVPIPVDDIGPSAMTLLQYLDQVRTESGGAALDMQGPQAQVAGQTWRGTELQYSVKEKLADMFYKVFSETLIYSLLHITHKMLRAYWTGPIQMKVGDEWVQASPSQWPERDSVTVKSSKRKADGLNLVLQLQQAAIQMGGMGTFVDESRIYNALLDISRANNVTDPEQYWLDPQSQQAMQFKQQQAQAAQAQAQQQQQLSQMVIDMQIQIVQLRELNDRYKAEIDTAYKYWKGAVDAEVEEAKIVGAASSQLTALQLSGQQAAAAMQRDAEQTAKPKEQTNEAA